MKKTWKLIPVCTLVLFILAGVLLAPAAEAAETDPVSGAAASSREKTASSDPGDPEDQSGATELEISVSKRDASGEYDASEAVTLSPEDELTITASGVYILSGSYEDVMIVIDAGEEDKVQLVLVNADITNENGPAIYVRSADKVFLTAAEGTVNSISDGADYTFTDEDAALDAAVFSREDLTINGAGTLTISGNYKHAVVSKDDLVVTTKDLSVNAVNVGLNGKDSVTLSEATVVVTAGSDGVRSENGAEEDKGYVAVVDSSLTIVSGKDGVQAETVFIARNAEITVSSGGGSGARSSASTSGKGIKAGVSVTIDGGVYRIDSLDDAIHTNGSVLISGGDFTIESRDDGIHANEKAEIAGGSFDITASEGIEATYVLISGGEITITASDDGVNAARKSASYTPTVEITGGTLTITMGAGDTDGVDCNGNIIITGGTVSVSGNSSFDYDGTATFTGGTVYVNGQQVTTLPNQFMGGFGGGMGGFGGFGGMGGEPGGDMGGFGGMGGEPGGDMGGFGGQGGPGGHGGFGGGHA